MIEELRIEHLGVISAASVRPGAGFTALTGETGAGKTMVLTALEMLLGGRVDSAISEGASIEGVWSVTPDSPAMRAGLHSGDIVLSIDGKKIHGNGEAAVDAARKMLGDLKQDQVVKLGYARAGKTGTISVKADQIHRVMVFERGEGGPPPQGSDRAPDR